MEGRRLSNKWVTKERQERRLKRRPARAGMGVGQVLDTDPTAPTASLPLKAGGGGGGGGGCRGRRGEL